MLIYNWQQKDWIDFKYAINEVKPILKKIDLQISYIKGILDTIPSEITNDMMINILVTEAMKTSEIEGEFFSREDVLSSIKRNLGLLPKSSKSKNNNAAGIGELMIKIRNDYKHPISEEVLHQWHSLIFKEKTAINIGVWRSHLEPMQVISGSLGKIKIHFEAPPSKQVPKEMKLFIKWYNDNFKVKSEKKHFAVISAIAHLYFESIHPYEDGNGRIGRAIADKAILQGVGYPIFISLSKTIEVNKKQYYANLEKSQKSNEITSWIKYFVTTIHDAFEETKNEIHYLLKKVKFFDRHKDSLNERQLKVIIRMFDEGNSGFQGGINAQKYISITKSSKATATRDLTDLAMKEIIIQVGAGRSTRYELKI